MNHLSPDEIDFAAYEWQTNCKAKVRQAVSFAEELADALEPNKRDKSPSAFSFKVGKYLRFRPKEVTAWAGYSGHRKSMLTGQLAVELAHQHEKTLVVSLEMSPAVTLSRMARQHTGKAVPRDLTRFLDATGDLYLFDHVGRLTPKECMAVCRYFAEELGGKQVFIDSFMMVCTSEEKLDEQKQMATDLVRLAQDTGLHVHVVAHCRKPSSGDESKPPGKHDLRGAAAITDQCHNVITVWANKPKQEAMLDSAPYAPICAEPDALLTVCKQRNGEFEGRLKLWFDPQSMRFLDEQTSEVAPW
jgi:twinkle protein